MSVHSSVRSTRSGVSTIASETFPEDLPPVRKTKTPEVMRRGEVMEATGHDGEQMRLKVTGELGKGSYGTVLLTDDDRSSQKIAVKVIHPKPNKKRDVYAAGRKEVSILGDAKHPNVVRVMGSWENERGYHVAMEYATRGDAFDIVDFYGGGCPEPLAGKVALGLFSALAHIHSKGIVHRDVKPENLFIKDNGDVVLGDFGLAGRKKSDAELLRTPCGTMTYRAPEIVRGEKYGPGVDVWSAGLTIYTLLTGYDPWATSAGKMSPAATAQKILAGKMNRFPRSTSNAAKDFVRSCVNVDPSERLTAAEALDHPWMRIATVFTPEDLPQMARYRDSDESN